MSLANTGYDITGGFEVTQGTTTNTNDTVTVSSGVYRTRTPGTTTYGNSAYTSVVGAAISGVIAYASTGYKRIDLVIVDTSTLATAPFKIITGTPVLTAATAAVPGIGSSSQFPIATIAVSDSAISRRTDVRDTPDYLPVRAFNRSQAVRIGKQVVRSNANVYVDLNDPVSAKELAYHSSIGAVYHTGSLTSAPNDFQVNTGLKVSLGTFASSTQPIKTDAGEVRNADNQVLYPVAAQGTNVFPDVTVASATATSTVITYVAPNNYVVGQTVTISNMLESGYNITGAIATRSSTGFTINASNSISGASTQGGTAKIAVPVAGTSNLRNDLVYLDISNPNSPFYGLLNGTAAAGTAGLAGVRFADLTKDQLPIAVVIAPASGTAFSAIDVRPVR
jgi:hypothetical protein